MFFLVLRIAICLLYTFNQVQVQCSLFLLLLTWTSNVHAQCCSFIELNTSVKICLMVLEF